MQSCKSCWWAAVLLLVGAMAGMPAPAQAAVSFSFDVGPAKKEVLPGQQFTVDVNLVETLTNGSPSLLAAQGGLTQAQVTIMRLDVGGTVDPTRITGYTLNPAFTGEPSINDFGDDVFDVTLFMDFAAFSGPDGSGTGGVIRLATLTLTAGSVINESTKFDVRDFAGFDETITFNNTVLDPLISPTSFTVATPEPSVGIYLLAIVPPLRRKQRCR